MRVYITFDNDLALKDCHNKYENMNLLVPVPMRNKSSSSFIEQLRAVAGAVDTG